MHQKLILPTFHVWFSGSSSAQIVRLRVRLHRHNPRGLPNVLCHGSCASTSLGQRNGGPNGVAWLPKHAGFNYGPACVVFFHQYKCAHRVWHPSILRSVQNDGVPWTGTRLLWNWLSKLKNISNRMVRRVRETPLKRPQSVEYLWMHWCRIRSP